MTTPGQRAAGVYGYQIDCDLPLTRLRAGATDRGSITVSSTGEELLSGPGELVSLGRDPHDDAPVFAVARAASSLLTWCAVSGSSRIDPSGPRIWARGQGDPTAWEDRLLNTLIPLLLAEQGDLVLHAAALATNAGAVVVCGPSGRGKSTLAAVLAAQGLPVLAEDAVTVTLEADRILLWPGPAGVRLDPVTAQTLGKEAHALVRGKQMHFPAEPAPSAEAVPLAAIVALDPRGGSKAEVKAVTGPDALAAIFYNVLRLEIETWQPVFSLAAEVIRRVPCYTARLPDDLSRVSRIAPWLVADVTGAAAGVQAA